MLDHPPGSSRSVPATIGRFLRSMLGRAGLVAGLASGPGIVAHAQPALPPFNQEPYTHPQRSVTIAPGRTLNLYCTGSGTPTVVLDSGWGGPTTAWAYVQPGVARFTRVCSYDRAGQGFSGPGPLPRDTDALVGDLHGLLHAAGLRPPFVLVGHSLAGLDAVLFADRYSDELAGMVLVDPAFPHQAEQMSRIPEVGAILRKTVPDFAPCEAAARAHRLPVAPLLVDLCLNHDPAYGVPLVRAMDQMSLRPELWTSLASEIGSFGSAPGAPTPDVDSQELDRASASFGAMPLVVLTAGNKVALPGLSVAQADALFGVWNHGHDLIAALSSRGRNQLVPDTSHYIQFYQPGTVIDAIHEVVADTRDARSSSRARLP